jgi:hypothetical protein
VVLITCLSNVASQVGIGRIVGGSKFHYPAGQPELPPEEELRWRANLMEKALKELETPMTASANPRSPE